nr:MATE family efflux transporter [uncultured Peptostreptococcus sp.]
MNKNSEELLSMRPIDIMVKLSVPAILGMIVIGLYPLMDGIFAGQILGQKEMTAVGIAMPFTYFNTGVSTLIGVGSASVLSRALGKRDRSTIDKIMANLSFWVILFSTIITIVGIVFCEKMLALVGASGDILNYASRYLRIIFIGSIFVNFTQAANMVMRGEGLMKRAMMIMGAGALINIVLDPILMISMGEYGVEGAAIATVTAQVIQGLVTIYYFKVKSETVKIRGIRNEQTISKEVFCVGVSAMLMQVLTIIQQSLLYSQAFKYGGDQAAAIMAVVLRVLSFSFIPIWGMSQGLQPAIGANYGAGNFDRVRSIFKVFTLGSFVLAGIFWIPSEILTKNVLMAFGIKEMTLAMGIPAFRMLYSVFILYGLMIMILTFFQSIGDGKTAGLLVMLRQIILFVPVIFLLPMLVGINGIWLTIPLVDLSVVVLSVFKYMKKSRNLA